MATRTLTFTRDRLAQLNDKYAKAKEAGLEEFNFDGYIYSLGMPFI